MDYDDPYQNITWQVHADDPWIDTKDDPSKPDRSKLGIKQSEDIRYIAFQKYNRKYTDKREYIGRNENKYLIDYFTKYVKKHANFKEEKEEEKEEVFDGSGFDYLTKMVNEDEGLSSGEEEEKVAITKTEKYDTYMPLKMFPKGIEEEKVDTTKTGKYDTSMPLKIFPKGIKEEELEKNKGDGWSIVEGNHDEDESSEASTLNLASDTDSSDTADALEQSINIPSRNASYSSRYTDNSCPDENVEIWC